MSCTVQDPQEGQSSHPPEKKIVKMEPRGENKAERDRTRQDKQIERQARHRQKVSLHHGSASTEKPPASCFGLSILGLGLGLGPGLGLG